MTDLDEWVALPCEGALVTKVVFRGNPKDGELCIETMSNPITIIPTHGFELSFDAGVALTICQRALDDVNFEQTLEWPGGVSVQLTVARVLWWLPRKAWEENLASWGARRRWELGAIVSAKARLGLAV